MLKKILIANRGEIAVRIIRACREMGIKTVAVYSETDKTALHTKLADEAICIGPAPSVKSYLNVKAIIEAACLTGADSIHPGFGFLSENSSFAKMCDEIGLKFIGPRPEIIELMGNKSKAKETMKDAGVPVVPGSDGLIYTMQEAINISNQIGYPVMLKASAGGGGKGIRVAYNEDELKKAYEVVKQEAAISFNDESIYIEKFIENPRHIEIQVMADEHGNAIHLGERDCTVQRRNQKMLEETPSGIIDSKLREKMKYKQKDIIFTGHSLEARINAENPAKNFMPCPGLVEELHLPGGKGIRVDTAVYAGYRVPQNYDSMIAKVIVHGKDRKESIAKMKSALSELVISGIETNTDFILKILDNEKFKANDYDTSFIEKEFGK